MTFDSGHPSVVDVDDATTWPRPLADLVRHLVDAARSTGHDPENYQDLDIHRYEAEVHQHLAGCLLRARHCTRLLDHEAESIRVQGLRLLNADLVNERLDQAHARGYLTAADHEILRTTNVTVPTGSDWGRRQDQVCLVLSTGVMAYEPQAVELLLSHWGGEAIYWPHFNTDRAMARTLRGLGRPAIVTALLDFTVPGAHKVFPSVVHTLVGKELGQERASADVHCQASIPAPRIESIVFPGDPAYDRFPELPRD